MSEYRKKPVVIEAERFDPTTMPLPFSGRGSPCQLGPNGWFIETLEGPHALRSGDMVIRGVKGEFYPCKPDIFALTYEDARLSPERQGTWTKEQLDRDAEMLADAVMDSLGHEERVREVAAWQQRFIDHYAGRGPLSPSPPPPSEESARKMPRVVCLCGSTRFFEEFQEESLRRTVAGEIVLSIGCNLREDRQIWADPVERDAIKARLDELHLRKIDMADYVRVLNVGGYVGPSTRKEIEYAKATGKPVEYLEPLAAFKGGE